ncbi:MAG: hypothetical protein NTZ95_00125 [Candidatus Omnitrophica bacterium]|nr:hypothetical protein [Candidatus Omnitrophota bacterium]
MFPNPLKLSTEDLFGRFYLKVPGDKRFENYYRSLDTIKSFLYSEEWLSAVTGYYINTIGDFDAVRLSYFTTKPEKVLNAVSALKQKTGVIESQQAEAVHKANVSEFYGGEELRFRRFLCLYTLIGLDLIAADLSNVRCLMTTFRWQITLPRKPVRPYFENTFRSQSQFYRSLSTGDKEQFWLDLSNWPNPPQVDWAHMMVNMILPGDWNKNGRWKAFLAEKPPKTIPEINNELENIGLDFRISPPVWNGGGMRK